MKILYKGVILTLVLLSTIVSNAQKKTIPTIYKNADREKMYLWVDSVFNQMTMDERIGQLFMPIVPGDNTTANKNAIVKLVKNQLVGGLLFSKGTPTNQAILTNAVQSEAKTPLMISLDGEWGLSMRLSNTTIFPKNMMLGAIQDDSLLYKYGLEVARQCKLMGIHVNFAPDIDINSNPANPVIGNRSYGEDTKRVAKLGIMYSKGLEDGGVMAVSKHFPGHGDTSTDSHKTLPVIEHDRDRLDDMELYPFKEYIKSGLSGIMVGHLDVPALESQRIPSSLSTAITTDLLQSELGFSGLIFTDGLQMKGVTGTSDYCIKALLAGNDILLGPINTAKEYASVKQAVQDGILSDSLINAKCRKILIYKYILGVNKIQKINTKTIESALNTPTAEALNRELNEASITLVKDDTKIVPLKELNKRKIVAISIGAPSDNIFQQTLKLYTDVQCFSVADSNELNILKDTLSDYTTIIISIHGNRSGYNNAIINICKDKESIITYFDLPYRMNNYTTALDKADAVIVAYENTNFAQEYAAQAIFGGNKIDGKLPVTIAGLYKEGKGIKRKKVRLSYNLPESVNIPSAKLDTIGRIIDEAIKQKAFPGCQVLIAKNGVIIYNQSYGTFDYNRKNIVTNSTIYDLASMSKATGTLPAIMKLYDEHKLSTNDPVSKFVPAFKGTDKNKITIREALFHESRLAPFIPYYVDAIDTASYKGKLLSRKRDAEHPAMIDNDTWGRIDFKYKTDMVSITPRKGFVPLADSLYVNSNYGDIIIEAIAKSKLLPRKRYMYSCLNFMMLKEVVEHISKTDLSTFMQKNFFAELGATTTTYNPLNKFPKEIIAPTENDKFLRKQIIQGYVHDEGAAFFGGVSGNAGLFSNANDLAKLYQMFLNGGSYGGEEYLSEKNCKMFTSMKSPISRRGLGFDKPEGDTGKYSPCSFNTPISTYGHTGFTGTCFWIDPENNLIYIFLSNRVYDTRTNTKLSTMKIRERIQEAIYNALQR